MPNTININKYWEKKSKQDLTLTPFIKYLCNYSKLTKKQRKWLSIKLFIKNSFYKLNFDKLIDRAIYYFIGVACGAVSYHLLVAHLINLKTK